MVTGAFRRGTVFVAVTPCDARHLPWAWLPANYLGALNPWTGHVTAVSVTGPAFQPKGLLSLGA